MWIDEGMDHIDFKFKLLFNSAKSELPVQPQYTNVHVFHGAFVISKW